MGYSKRTLSYSKRITSLDLTHMMSAVDPVAIDVHTPRIDSKCSLEKELNELICMKP